MTIPEQKKTFRLRRATMSDSSAIRQVATATWDATYAQTVRSSNRARVISHSYSDNSLRRSLRRADRDSWFWVAEAADSAEIVGFAEVILRPGAPAEAELTRIYVLPEWQDQGIGKALVEVMLLTLRQLAPDLRPPRLWLSVEAHNERAKTFYERRGFRYFRDFYANLPGQMLEMQEYVLEI